jgi:hypothetical protein
VPGASKKQVKRVAKTAIYYKINNEGSLVARKNVQDVFDIKIPKIEEREDLTEHELGHQIIYALDKKKIIWKRMRKFIEGTISKCEICIKHG